MTQSRTAQVKERIAASGAAAADSASGAAVARRLDPAGDLLDSMEGEFRKCLPEVLPWDTFARIALTGLRKTPQLIECSRATLLGALMECARLGLQPMTEYASLVPFKNFKAGNRLECQLIVGYQGYIQLMMRSPLVEAVECELVYEADEYENSIGDGGRFFHRPADHLPPDERGQKIRAYAFVRLRGGGRTRVAVTPRWKAEELQRKYGNVWKSDFEAMWLKTPLRQVQKYAPKSSELQRALAVDGATVDLGGVVTRPDGLDDYVEGAVVEPTTEPATGASSPEEWPPTAKPADAQ